MPAALWQQKIVAAISRLGELAVLHRPAGFKVDSGRNGNKGTGDELGRKGGRKGGT